MRPVTEHRLTSWACHRNVVNDQELLIALWTSPTRDKNFVQFALRRDALTTMRALDVEDDHELTALAGFAVRALSRSGSLTFEMEIASPAALVTVFSAPVPVRK